MAERNIFKHLWHKFISCVADFTSHACVVSLKPSSIYHFRRTSDITDLIEFCTGSHGFKFADPVRIAGIAASNQNECRNEGEFLDAGIPSPYDTPHGFYCTSPIECIGYYNLRLLPTGTES